MVSAGALAICAQASFVFYGGDNCMSISTIHTTTAIGVYNSDDHVIFSCIESEWCLGKNCDINPTSDYTDVVFRSDAFLRLY